MIQAALTVWVLALVLRLYDRDTTPARLLALVAALSVATSLPWLTSILLTDIFVALAVFALHLLLFRDDALARWERGALMALVAFAAATHSATFVVLLAVGLSGGAISLFAAKIVPRRAVGGVGMTLGAGAARHDLGGEQRDRAAAEADRQQHHERRAIGGERHHAISGRAPSVSRADAARIPPGRRKYR